MLNNGKEALLQWVQQQTSLDVVDFSTSWKDGMALCVLVNSIWPKKIDLSSLPSSPEERLAKGLEVAGENGAPQIVEPSEFGSNEIEASLIMLISQLYQIFKAKRPSPRSSRQQQRQSQFISHIPYCGKCNNPLSMINVECGGKHYHTECFACSLCETKLTNSCIVIGSNPFCDPCGKKSFKIATWKLHKKDKDRWWLDLWRTSTHQFPGLTKEAAGSRISNSDSATDDTGDELDDDLFYSDDESEGESPQQTHHARNSTSSIHHDDVLLDQIEDKLERQAFIELFARLPEPEPVAVQLRLTATPISSSPLNQPARSSFQEPQVSSPDDARASRSRAHRSAMFISPAAIIKDPPSPSTPPKTTTATTTPARVQRPRNRDSVKPAPPPSTSLSALSTRSAVAYSVNLKRPPLDSEDASTTNGSSSPSSSPHSSPMGSPRDTSRDSVYSNFSVSELSDTSAADRTSIRAPASPTPPPRTASPQESDEERKKTRFSRMFEANISKLLSTTNLEEEEEDPPIREGFLIKKMDLGVVRPWQRRYFLLRRDQLLYFVNKESRQKGLTLGIIPLSSVSQINPITPALWSRFQLVGENGMSWFLQASSRSEMLIWQQALRRACNVRNEEKLQELSTTAGLSLNSLQKKEGAVEVRHKTTWATRWIVLKDGILWEYASKEGALKAKIALYKCQLNEYQPPAGLVNQFMDRNAKNSIANSFAFQVKSPTRNTIIRTTSAEEMHGWLNAILKQKVIVEEIIENIALEPE